MNEINKSREEKENILIHDSISPVAAIDERNNDNFFDSSSFVDSMESNFNLAKRFQTEDLNDSWERNTL